MSSAIRWASRSPPPSPPDHSELVDRLVNIDEGPAKDDCSLPFLAKLEYAPVLGEAVWRVAPDFLVKDGYSDAFAPGYEVPDFVVDDYDAMTFTSFEDSKSANEDYREETSLADRLSPLAIPLLSIFGAEDQICDARRLPGGLPLGPRREGGGDRGRRPLPQRREAGRDGRPDRGVRGRGGRRGAQPGATSVT